MESSARTASRRTSHRPRIAAAAFALVVCLATAGWAQFIVMEGPSIPPRFPPEDFRDGALTICKLMFTSVRREANGYGWSTDYPFAAMNLTIRASELTKTRISRGPEGEPHQWVVRLTDDALFECPFIVASDVGTIGLTPFEAARLRDYLLKGGFLWVDDFWGDEALTQFSAELRKALPEYLVEEIPLSHPIRHAMFDVTDVPQVPGINFWYATGGTSERGLDSLHPGFYGVADDYGRLMVVMTHNTDIGDAMEREAENPAFFAQFSPAGYALTIDMVLYALTH